MPYFVLLKGELHNKCICFQEVNRFGDQVLIYRYETIEGTTKYKHELNHEENWLNQQEMLANAQEHFKEIWNS